MGGFFLRWKKGIFKKILFVFKIIFFLILALGIFFFIFTLYYLKDLPQPEFLEEIVFPQSTKIYDRTGQILLYEFSEEEKRISLPFDKYPDHLKNAILAAEDINFYSHLGIDFLGLGRAILEDLKVKKFLYGGSTISQQLARILFLTKEKTAKRKIREAILALELDFKYPKEKIFEMYLNNVPMGGILYGIESASQAYFGKTSSQLSLVESATLAAMIKAPSFYSPFKEDGKRRLLERKDHVLDLMVKRGMISTKEAENAKKEEIKFSPPNREMINPYFTFFVKEELEKMYGKDFLLKNYLKVFTTLDPKIQKIAEEELKKGIEKNKKYNAFNGGVLVIDSETGDILAMAVGNSNYFSEPEPKGCIPGKNCKFDPMVNVTLTPRQPGSALKPFIYAKAFEKGFDDETIVNDEPMCFGEWGGEEYCPQNYDQKFRGPVTLRMALGCSLNVPSVYVFVYLSGMEEGVELMKRCGIEIKPPITPSIVLGGKEVNLLSLTAAYSCFSNHGERVLPQAILKIEDASSNVIYERKVDKKRVISPQIADLVADILADNEARTPVFGAHSPLYFPEKKVSVKTGTSSDFKDNWTVGFYKNFLIGVWVGNNNGEVLYKSPGVLTAAPIFHQIIERIAKEYP